MGDRLSDEQVQHVARLARLRLEPDQVHFFSDQLSHVLDYIDKLNQRDVDGVKPMAHPIPLTDRLRDDEPAAGMPGDLALRSAPDSDPPFFKVPKVLGEGGGA